MVGTGVGPLTIAPISPAHQTYIKVNTSASVESTTYLTLFLKHMHVIFSDIL